MPFLAKLQAATHRACSIYMRATPIDAITAPLWSHFHGQERRFPPSYIHVLDILYEMGIYTNVEMVHVPANPQLQFSSLEQAVEAVVELLILPDDEQTRTELRSLLAQWLVKRDGVLMSPVEDAICAIMWWTV